METRLEALHLALMGGDPAPAPAQIGMPPVVRQHDPRRFPLACGIEQSTKRFITIDSRLNSDTISKCHPQEQSSLFSKLPAEIRNEIWSLATLSTSLTSSAVMKADRKPDMALLSTCRRIWLESNSYPLSQYTPSFYASRRCPWMGFMDNLTPVNVEALRSIHITIEVDPVREMDGVSILESLPFQPWPVKLIISFMSKPISSEEHADLGACIARMLKHDKMSTVRELQINVEEIKSKAGYLPTMLEQLAQSENQLFELGITDWRPVIDPRATRTWKREATNNLPYETFQLVYRRRTGTVTPTPQNWSSTKANSWHLIPWREMYYDFRTLARLAFTAEDRLAEEWKRAWKEQNSLLKFADE